MAIWKISDHAMVDKFIREKDNEKIQALKAEAFGELEEVKFYKSANMAHPNYTKKEIELMIELVVKTEAYEQGKGWLFRAKRRTELVMEYT